MKEFVYVEFVFHPEFLIQGENILRELGEDFLLISSEIKQKHGTVTNWQAIKHISGKINSASASIIIMTYPELFGKMKISYIPDDMKDKYRRGKINSA